MYVCMYACMYVCMYVCIYMYIYMYIYIYVTNSRGAGDWDPQCKNSKWWSKFVADFSVSLSLYFSFQVTTPHSGLRKDFRQIIDRKPMTLSIGTPLCPYPFSYCRAYGLFASRLFWKNFWSPLSGSGLRRVLGVTIVRPFITLPVATPLLSYLDAYHGTYGWLFGGSKTPLKSAAWSSYKYQIIAFGCWQSPHKWTIQVVVEQSCSNFCCAKTNRSIL